MKSAWISCLFALAVIATLPGCSRQPPEAPLLHTLTGHVRLTGYLVDAGGAFAGTRVVGDPDGVRVDLMHGSAWVASALTVKGIYRFTGLAAGDYVARTRVIGTIGDDTNRMTIIQGDVASADTLRVDSIGDIYPVPNPIGASTTLFFSLPDTEQVAVRILDAAGNPVRTLYAGELLPGLKSLVWNGDDPTGHPVTQTLYWATLVAGLDVRAQLLFK